MERTYIRFSGCDFCAGRVVETLGDGTVQWGWRPDGEPMGASTFMFERGCKQCGGPRDGNPARGASPAGRMTTFSDIAAIYRAKREVWLERGREAKSKAGKAGRALQLGHPHVRVPKKGQNDARVLLAREAGVGMVTASRAIWLIENAPPSVLRDPRGRIETGSWSGPSRPSTIRRLAEALDIDSHELLVKEKNGSSY